MFIKLFRSGYSLQLVIVLVISLLLWVESFINPLPAMHEFTPAPLYNITYYLIRNIPVVQVILAFLLLFVQAFLLNNILIENGIVRKNSFLAALIYFLIMSHANELFTLYPALIANFLLIIVLYYLLKIFNQPEAYADIFNAGFLTGLASLFYLPASFFLALFWITLFIYSILSWREWIITLIGFFVPFLFLFTFYYLDDRLFVMSLNYIEYFLSIGHKSINLSTFSIIILSMTGLFVLLAIINTIISLNTKTIANRKRSIIIIWFFLISLTTLLLPGRSNNIDLALTFVPASALIASYFSEIKKKIVVEILFAVFVMLIVVFRFI